MSHNCASLAQAYYAAVGKKDVRGIEKYLHPKVQVIGPLGRAIGREAVLEATKKFTEMFETLSARLVLGSESHAMVVYDLQCKPPIGNFSASNLMTFEEGMITQIELFYDPRSMMDKKEEIFSSNFTESN